MTPGARPPLLSVEDALARLLAHATPLPAVDCDTLNADGRVLADDVVAEIDVPSQDNSAMDGYAVRAADLAAAQPLAVSQRVAAGAVPVPLVPGTVARIFTGASVPPGADAVVMQEQATLLGDGRVQFTGAAPAPGACIRRAGEDVRRGSVVLARGLRLGPAALGLAAGIGRDRLRVTQAPRVALFSTGDELVLPGAVAPRDLPPGAIYNSNRFFLRALLQRAGCTVTDCGIVPDERAATAAALRDAARSHDVVLTSGGVSVGEEDHVKPAVESQGALALWSIALKPGKPFAFGHLERDAGEGGSKGGGSGRAHFIGLPGNPVSSFVTFLVLVRPFLLALQGATTVLPERIAAVAHFDWPRADARREYLRVRRNAEGGLDLFAHQGSGVLASAAWADGLVDNPPGVTIARGDTVAYLPFSSSGA